MVPRRFTTSLVALLGLAVPAFAQDRPLHIETALGSQRDVELDLENAVVSIVIDPDATPWMEATGPDDAAAPLFVDWSEGPTRVVRPLPQENTPYPSIELELVVLPSQRIRIEGSGLTISVLSADARDAAEPAPETESEPEVPGPPGAPPEGTAPEPATAAPTGRPRAQRTPAVPPDEEPGFALEIGVADSRVDLVDVADALVVAAGGSLRIEGSRGSLTVVATDGCGAEILDHEGSLELEAQAGDIAVFGGHGNAQLQIEASNVIFRDGRGDLSGTASGALFVVDNWQGATVLEASQATVEVRGATAHGSLSVQGDDIDIDIDGFRGKVDIVQRRGTLRAREWFGISDLRLDGTEIDLADLSGPMAIKMNNGARGTIENVQGQVRAAVVGSSLEVTAASNLHLDAKSSDIVARAPRRIDAFKASASTVQIDVTDTPGRIDVDLRSGTRADIRMTAPCYVVVTGPAASANLGSEVRVSGCEVMMGQARRGGRTGRRGIRPRFLYTRLAADAELVVDGVP